ncbi:L-type lectin-domain containing receptor kinase IX.1 [Camellia lanceoleosa]|uniref:L-type lectin-domain containing receptor kinase IX.1 n=1 Tax=Camellia lanceoleosa TaxID=1840588 RepID=A0ACC0FUW9_9ERIC|nr:L-type lectin-domain containing receptor kinase IX.1 [Camellia lanceoleosa]
MAMAMAMWSSWNPQFPSSIILLCCFFFTLYYFHLHATALSFNFTNINSTLQNREIPVDSSAYITTEGIQVTPNERGQDQSSQAGRARYRDPLHLWDKASGNLTDFNTYFMFVIDSNRSNNYGDGLTFFLVSNDSTTNITPGQAIGLPIDPQTFKPTSPFVAVEFDTYPNKGWDPNYTYPATHVGININSINSSATAQWYNNITYGIQNEAWINYNSSSKNLSVIFTGSINNQRIESSLSYLVDLRENLTEWVTIGFSASTGSSFEKNNVKSWTFNSTQIDVPTDPDPDPSPAPAPNTVTPALGKKIGAKTRKALVVGCIVGSLVLVGGLALVGFGMWKKSRAKEEDEFAIELSMNNEFEAGTGPKKFSYGQLFRATNHFAEEQKLGEGGFGGVYRGFLKESNSYVAVKRISQGSKQGIKEYASEVKIISQLRHRNLVQLLGWCHDRRELLLVYEFMENGSLDYHLFKENSLLTWARRYKIAQGLASALFYLHEEWEQCVVHRDVKSSNVMLDSNFNAKLGDFGLARLVDHGKVSQTIVLAGTIGYMAPECLVTGKANKESDVFSFGVVALEIACGRKPIDLKVPESQMRMVEWVWDLYGTGRLLEAAVDPKICPDFAQKEMECLMIVGLWCAHPDHNLRPSIQQAIHVLNFEAPLPILPAKMPVPMYFAPPMNASSLVSLTSGCTTISDSSQVHSSSYSYNTDSSKFTSSSSASSPSASFLY